MRKNANQKNPWISPNITVVIAIVLWNLNGIRYPLLISIPIVAVVNNERRVKTHPYMIRGNHSNGVNASCEIIDVD